MKKLILSGAAALLAGTAFCAATTHLSLDCREGAKVADKTQTLVYDASWYAGGVTAKIAADGEEIVSGAVGAFAWTPTTDGAHLLTLNVYNTADNVVGTERVWCLSREDSTELVIPDGVTEISEYAFAGGRFTSVTIPNSVTNVAPTAFAGCSNVVEVTCGRLRLSGVGVRQRRQAEILLPFDGDFVNAGSRGDELVSHGGQFVSDRFGREGRAYYFNGNGQNAYFANDSAIKVEDTFTIAFWFKTDVSVSSHGSSSTAWNPGNYAFFPANSGGGSGFGVKVGTDGVQVCEHGSCYLPTVLNYTANIGLDWNHVAVAVENSGAIRLYLNGELVSAGYGSARKRYAVPSGVGGGEWGYYTGAVDDVAVFDHAMTDDEVLKLISGLIGASGGAVSLAEAFCDLFPDSYAKIKRMTICEGVTAIPDGYFEGCDALESLTLPSTLADFGDNDMRKFVEAQSASGLCVWNGWVLGYKGQAPRSLTIPEGVVAIAKNAFGGQQNLEELILPDTLKRIGSGAFAGADKLRAVYFLGSQPTVASDNIFGPYDEIADGTRMFYKQGTEGWSDGTWCGVPTSAGPEVTIAPGGKTVFSGSVSVSITTPWTNAVVHYTADGTEPTEDSPVFKKLTVNRKATIKATAISPDCRFRRVVSAQFGTGLTENPTISSSQGTTYYYWDNMISFSCPTPDVEYYYTLDGSDPVEHGTKYTEPFPIAESLTVKVVAMYQEYIDSDVVSMDFTRSRYTVATPQIRTRQGTPLTETVNTVTLSCSTDGAVIYYSTGGKYVIYTDPFKISDATTVSAYAVKDDWIRSSTNTVEIAKTWYDGSDVGMPGRVFLSERGNVWTRDTAVKYDGGSSLRSAAIRNGGASDMQTSVTGKGTISFHWKTSCECDPYFPGALDHVEFCIDGIKEAVLDGETGWESFSKRIDTEGTHVLKWEYVKDGSESDGEDCAWVDAISFTPDAVAKIRFNGNESTSGELPTEITHYLGEAVTLPAQGSLARARYDFVGWSDGTEVHSPGSLYRPPDTDITLTAVWEPRISSTPTISVKETYSAKSVKASIYGSGDIYYTTDGTTPNENSMRYLGEFRVSGGTTVIKAIAIEDDKFPSAVASATTTCLWKSEAIGAVTWWHEGGSIVRAEGLVGKMVIPSTLGGQPVTKIGDDAFNGVGDELLAVVVPEGVVSIGAAAFIYCSKLQTVVLPSTLRDIGGSCFAGCTALAQVYWCMSTEPTSGDGMFDGANDNLVSHIPWQISTHLWNGHAWTRWTPPQNGASGMIKDVIGDYKLYTLTFDANGGTTSESSRRVEGGKASGTLPVPWRNGYGFAGWYTAASGGTKVTDATVITSDRALFAQWTIVNYAIAYELGGGVNAAGNPSTYTVNDAVALAAPTRSGYVFNGWTPDNGTIPRGSTGDRRFVASWVLAGGGVTYTLTFDGNGGTAAESTRTVAKDGAYETLPGAKREGYEFAGWYTAAHGGTPVSASTVATANARLYAHWAAIEYEIVYYLDGGRNNDANPATYTIEDAVALAVPTRFGYVFKGWVPDDGVIPLGSTGPKEFTANWEVAPDAVLRTVSFDANGGGTVYEKTRQVPEGSTLGTLPVVLREGYVLAGWYTAATGGTKISETTVISAAATFYAHWTPENYNIVYKLNGGVNAAGNPATYTIEDAITLAAPTRSGYAFVAWSPNNGVIAKGSTGDKTFTASWRSVVVPPVDPQPVDPVTPVDPRPEPHVLIESVAPVEAPGDFAAITYDGCLFRKADGAIVGTIQVKAAKAKANGKTQTTTTKLTVSMQLAGVSKKLSAKGEYDLAAGGEQAFEVKNRGELALLLGANGLAGSFEGFEIEAARNIFSAKDAKATAAAVEDAWVGAVNVVGGDVALAVSIANKGKVKVSGTVGGAKVSATSQLLVGDGGVCCVPVVITKKANLAFNLWLLPDRGVELAGLDGVEAGKAGTLRPGAAFSIVDGGDALAEALPELLDEFLPDGVEVAANGKKWIVEPDEKGKAAKAGKIKLVDGDPFDVQESANPSGLKLTYTAKTGAFKGSFKAYTLVNGKIKSYTVNVAGVMLGDRALGTATLKKPAVSFPIAIE